MESVAWLSSRGDLLAWTFVLLAFEVLHRPGAVRTGLGVVLVALACLAKESAIVAWALLPLRDLAMPAATRPPARTTWIRTLLLAAVTASYFAVRLHVMLSADDLPTYTRGDRPALVTVVSDISGARGPLHACRFVTRRAQHAWSQCATAASRPPTANRTPSKRR